MRANLPKLLILSTSFLITNCSTYKAPESVVAKMARFKSKHTNKNPVPKIKLWKVAKIRPPKTQKKKRQPSDQGPRVNPKKLYFTALYKQHSLFAAYLPSGQETTLNHCPAFHNTFLKIKSHMNTGHKTRSISKAKVNSLSPDAPLYSLPVNNMTRSIEETVTKNVDHHQTVYKAVVAHTKRTLLELKEICDTGTSENYYNFANVITHVNTNKTAFHAEKEKSMQSLLRTTIYSNLAILKNLDKVTIKGRFPASSTKKQLEVNEVNKVLGTDWTSSYFDSL